MDIEQAKTHIMSWLTDFVEKPNPDLGDWPPCPYARQARLKGEFDIRAGIIDPYTDLMHADMENFTVIAYVYDAAAFSAEKFCQQVRAVNQGFLAAKNIIALPDHPGEPEVINGVTMNQGTYAIVFIQPTDKLNHFARLIAEKGYYQDWPPEYLAELFAFREDPRS
jgi:hypothetical protein